MPRWLPANLDAARATLLKNIAARNAGYFDDERKKLDAWADDQIATSEKALKDIKLRIRDLRNEAGRAADLSEQARLQDEIANLERRQRKLRQEIFELEDKVLAERDKLVNAIKGKLQQAESTEVLFTLRWTLTGPAQY
jgi:predicted  nucleic acid-binding Zn-ribbon protein